MPTIDIGKQEIYYVTKGSGETLLLFPDNIRTTQAYDQDLDYFADRFQVLSFDYPGTGRSTHEIKYEDERQVDLWGYWADLACHLLQSLNIDRCIVLGSGWGALAALHLAGKQARQHKLIATAVIADSFVARFDSRTLHRALDVREHFYVRHARKLQQEHGDDWRQVVDADTAFLRQLADHGGYEVPEFVLQAIPCPVLLTGCLQDPLLPGLAAEFARLAALIPDCNLYLAARPGHPYLEHPFLTTNPQAFRTIADLFLATAAGGQ